MQVEITELKNGIKVITDKVSTVETAVLSFNFFVGSRNEAGFHQGTSHFLEHMVFKGTKTRTAFDISKAIEDIGGDLNAFTSREQTTWYAKALKTDFPILVDILSDIILNALFDSIELEKERKVIIQEITQSLDTPDDYIHDIFQEQAFGKDTPLGASIAGSSETVSQISKQNLHDYLANNYHAGNLVVVASGNVEHNAVVRLIEDKLSSLPLKPKTKNIENGYVGGSTHFSRENLAQMQIVLGYHAPAMLDSNYFDSIALANILGGGMSSRLFQEVREKRGLVYTIQAYNNSYVDNGLFSIYAGTDSSDAKEVLKCSLGELNNIAEKSVNNDELLRTKAQLKVGTMMSLESLNSRANRIASNMRLYGRVKPIDEVIARVESINADDIKKLANQILSSKPTLATTSGDSEFKFEF